MTIDRTGENRSSGQPDGTRPEETAGDPTGQPQGPTTESTGAPGAREAEAQRPDTGEEASGGGTAELEELRDRHLRLAAEFDNYRKRVQREQSEHSVRAQGKLVSSLLDAIDDLERVADYTPETTTVAALLEGVQMVERKLLRALETAGLERIEARGAPFDPEHHEALMTAETEHRHEDETVGEVFQKGYRFQGHLLRPARVQVRKHNA